MSYARLRGFGPVLPVRLIDAAFFAARFTTFLIFFAAFFAAFFTAFLVDFFAAFFLTMIFPNVRRGMVGP